MCLAIALALMTGCVRIEQRVRRISSSSVAPAAAPSPSSAAPPVVAPDLAVAERAVQAHPQSSQAHIDLAKAYVVAQRVPDAVTQLRTAARLDPHSEVAWHALARLYQATGALDEEYAALRHLVALNTHSSQAYLRLGLICLQLDWLKPAQPLLERAVQLAPDSPDAQLAMARYEFLTARTDAAIQRLQGANRQHPDNVAVSNLLAQYLLTVERYSEAAAVLKAGLKPHPNDRSLELLLAYGLLKTHNAARLPEVLATLQDVLRQGTPDVEVYSRLGQTYEAMQQPAEATTAYEHAVQLDPSFENVILALGRLYIRQGRKAEGERLINQYAMVTRNTSAYHQAHNLLRQRFDDLDAHRGIALWYLRLGNYPAASIEFQHVLETRPTDAQAREGLRKALLGMGRRAEASQIKS